jgi:hypothetical protein
MTPPEGGSSESDDSRPVAREIPTDRESPVGRPVVRGDRSVTGEHADDAVSFDPEDPESLRRAARTIRAFAAEEHVRDNLYVLRGAAAAAALVRGEGSYRAAASRASGEASVSFIRKWARVHDLPRSIRRQVAAGRLAPSAAKHIARLGGDDRLLLAWAALDYDLTVREVRSVVSDADADDSVEACLADIGVPIGEMTIDLPTGVYRELWRRAAVEDVPPRRIVVRALEAHLDDA